jgi:hypothetical protein
MNIVVNPIMSLGIKTPEQTAILPLLHVVLYKNKRKWKEHLVNYTFGRKNEKTGIEFESESGELKANLLASIDPVPSGQIECHYYREGHNIAKKIIRDLKNAPDGRPLLFVWERAVSSESVFYEALGIEPNNMVNLGVKLMTLKELGLSIKAPYSEFSKEDLGT